MKRWSTVQNFIENGKAPASETVASFEGFASKGDGGGSLWLRTGASGAPSQSPGDTGSALITDSTGAFWRPTSGTTFYFDGTNNWFPSPFGDQGVGLYQFNGTNWDYYEEAGGAVSIAITTGLITNSFDYDVETALTFSGYASPGDGGGAQWIKTASTDTPSQPPAARGDGTLTDANGAVWVIVADVINPISLGADKSGSDDSTSHIQAALNFAVSSSIQCKLPAGKYLITQQLTEVSTSTDFSFIGDGSNLTELNCQFDASASAIKIFNKTNFSIGGFRINGDYDTTKNVNQGVDLANLTRAYVADIEVHKVKGQSCWVISGSDQITNDDVHIERVRAYDCGGSGVQLQGARNSGISKCLAKNCGLDYLTNGMSGTGVYMKVPVEDCYHSDNTAINMPTGAFNVGSSYPGEKGKRLTFTNGRSTGCGNGIKIGEVEDSLFSNMSLGLSGENSDGRGDAVRLEGGALRNSFENISTAFVANSRAAVRVLSGAENNSVEITSNTSPVSGSLVAALEPGSVSNDVTVTNQVSTSVSIPVSNAGDENSYIIKGRDRIQRVEIASGAVTLESIGVRRLLLDNESGAATDDLDTISGGVDGMQISLSTFNDGEDVTLTESGNMQLSGSFTLDRASDTITLVYSDRVSKWLEVSRSDNLS